MGWIIAIIILGILILLTIPPTKMLILAIVEDLLYRIGNLLD